MATKPLLIYLFFWHFYLSIIKAGQIQIISNIKSNRQDFTIDCLPFVNCFWEKSYINHRGFQRRKKLIVQASFIVR